LTGSLKHGYIIKFCESSSVFSVNLQGLYKQEEDPPQGICVPESRGNFLRLNFIKEGMIMAGEKKSKTDVAARAESKGRVACCSNCGNKIEVVLSVSPNGKKRMRRICCEG
jgi:hypothetical protein